MRPSCKETRCAIVYDIKFIYIERRLVFFLYFVASMCKYLVLDELGPIELWDDAFQDSQL
jgi:hypothetical protein